jgi:Holliday junction resolvasome RuvABC endonuclease subunit
MNATTSLRFNEIVLAIHPIPRGFGWIVFEGPHLPLDWGVTAAKPHRITRVAVKFERILRRYEPSLLVLEDMEEKKSLESTRRVRSDLLTLAAGRGIESKVYSHTEVRRTFAHEGANSRYEIACAIGKHLAALSHEVPRQRNNYSHQQHNQPLFNAAAVAMTHFVASER